MSSPSKSMDHRVYKSMTAPNPLDAFPTKGDVIRRTFLKKKLLPKLSHSMSETMGSSAEDSQQWLFPDKIDPTFGVKGNSSTDQLSKSYRRISSSGLFVSPASKEVALSTLHMQPSKHKNYVLVEESRLQELIKLDEALQREKELLGQQCSNIVQDYQLSARIPIPATRYAIHTLCEQQMAKTRSEIMTLQSEWSIFCKQNHYNKPHLFIKDSYVKNAPLAQRALKLRLVREATETWALRKERDTMSYEDDLSFYTCLYYDALQRQRDYERYYILANRYGPMSEEEFHKDGRPGKRYYQKVAKGAIKLQLLWDRYWAMARLRRFRACRMIQKYWRRYITYKKLHPIINLRLKIGKKTYYIFCFARWKEYNSICKRIREALQFYLSNSKGLCFQAWKGHIQEVKNHRTRLLNRIAHRTRNAPVFHALQGWKQFIRNIKDLKRRLRRLFGFPHFDIWCEYTKWSKHVKKLNRKATTIQAMGRAFVMRKRFIKKKSSQLVLWHFALMILSRKKVERIRQKLIDREFEGWYPDEILRREERLNEIERQRLQRKQLFVSEREKASIKELQNHLSTREGNIQLEHEADDLFQKTGQLWNVGGSTRSLKVDDANPGTGSPPKKGLFGWSAEVRLQTFNRLSKKLRNDCLKFTRALESHNYDAKYPPVIRCIHPRCTSTFSTEAQYQHHVILSDIHQRESLVMEHPKEYIALHLLLKHSKGIDFFRNFYVHLCGLSSIVNYIDAWIAIQELKKLQGNSTIYYTKAMAIYDLYLADYASRKCDVFYLNKEDLISKFQNLKEMERIHYPGLFHHVALPSSTLRKILGMKDRDYVKWTIEKVLMPTIFEEFEYQCFLTMFNTYLKDETFFASPEYQQYQKVLAQEAHERHLQMQGDFREYRLKLVGDWTRGFRFHESQISKKANEAIEEIMANEIIRLYEIIQRKEVKRKTGLVRDEEQSRHEMSCLIADEAVGWMEENILEFIFDFYVRALLKSMWDVPEFRKGMLQYSGLQKTHMTKKMKMELMSASNKKSDSNEWFDQWFQSVSSTERKSIPLSTVKAAIILQRRVRGMLSRSKARKVFAKTYKKYYDQQSGSHYYVNSKTNMTSWNPPGFFKHLYPKARW